jgi:hypothetical protein
MMVDNFFYLLLCFALHFQEKKEEKLSRESWMMELPSNKLSMNLGLQARSLTRFCS